MGPNKSKPDFTGWATQYGVVCSDGLIIGHGAFDDADGMRVPLVYQHGHSDINNVLGTALIHSEKRGLKIDGFFDDTNEGRAGRERVRSGSLNALSIYATGVQKQGATVTHGRIAEVSVVLRGANPGATIEEVYIEHADGSITENGEIIIHSGNALGEDLGHADEEKPEETENEETSEEPSKKSVAEIYETFTDEQKAAVAVIAAAAAEALADGEDEDEDDSEEDAPADKADVQQSDTNNAQEGADVAHNVFDNSATGTEETLVHAENIEKARVAIGADIPRLGSLKAAVLAHADNYGIKDPKVLFPDAKLVNGSPDEIRRESTWVDKILNGATHLPYARFRSMYADLTTEQIRARGYVTGSKKLDTVYGMLRRETYPTTVYVKTKLDRDDSIDITDFNVLAWLDRQLMVDLREEIARAALLGDGRQTSSADKIKPENIRPVVFDDDIYAPKFELSAQALAFTELDMAAQELYATREFYLGKGTPTFFAPLSTIRQMLWARDKQGNRIYRSKRELADALEVMDIVEVPLMKGAKITPEAGGEKEIFGVFLNPADYHFGTDAGGAITSFTDFDIDYNQHKALKETRTSGALRAPGTALVILGKAADAEYPKQVKKTNSEAQLPKVH